MQIQSVSTTTFGKIGYNGGKVLGRGRKSSNLVPSHARLDKGYKSQIKQTYNSFDDSMLADELSDICDSIRDKVAGVRKKFLPKK